MAKQKATLRGELLNPGRFLAAPDLKGKDWTMVIEKVEFEEVVRAETGQKETVPVVWFKKAKKGWIINRTNEDSIIHMHGKVAENWGGKEVTIYPTTTRCGRETVDCIRVRETKFSKPPAKEPEPPQETVGAKQPYDDIPFE